MLKSCLLSVLMAGWLCFDLFQIDGFALLVRVARSFNTKQQLAARASLPCKIAIPKAVIERYL